MKLHVEKKITTRNGDVFKIYLDKEDEFLFDKYKWWIKPEKHTAYIQTTINGKNVRFHRMLMKAKDGLFVDHKNRNGLDNRKSNLRLVSRSDNAKNSISKRIGANRFKGISYCKEKRKWTSEIRIDGKRKYLGTFETDIEAAQAYNIIAKMESHIFLLNIVPDPSNEFTARVIKTYREKKHIKKNTLVGVFFHKKNKRWIAKCRNKYIGSFSSEKEAHSEYLKHKKSSEGDVK